MKASRSLEDIKNSWQDLSNDRLKKDVSAGDMQRIVRQKSRGELNKIKRKLLFETILSILLLPVYLVYIHKVNMALAYLTDIFLVVAVAALSIPSIRLLRIGKFRNQETLVFLRKFVFHFNKTIKGSVIILSVIFPLFFLSAAVLGYSQSYQTRTASEHFEIINLGNLDQSTITIGITILGLLVLSSVVLLFIKLYYTVVYGKHVNNLKSFLNELEASDNENAG